MGDILEGQLATGWLLVEYYVVSYFKWYLKNTFYKFCFTSKLFSSIWFWYWFSPMRRPIHPFVGASFSLLHQIDNQELSSTSFEK